MAGEAMPDAADSLRTLVEETVADNRRALIFVRGGPGTGKSTAFDSALFALNGADTASACTVVRIHCGPHAAKQPFWLGRAFADHLGLSGVAARQANPLLEPGSSKIRPALWAIAERTGSRFTRIRHGAAEGPSEAATARLPTTEYTVLSGLSRLAANVMSTGPLVLAVDDLQWCDEQSLRWIDYVLRRSKDRPLIVLATVCTPAPAAVLGVAGDHLSADYGRILTLGPLDSGGTRAMLTKGTGVVPGPEFVEASRLISGGHRGTLAQLVRALSGAGVVPTDESIGQLHHVAMSVIEAHAAETMAGQPEHVHHVVRAIALLASTDIELVSALSGVPTRGVRAGLEFLRDNHFLASSGDGFRHELVRVALLSAAPDYEVTWMRDRAARLLNDAGLPAEVVADQLLPLDVAPEPWMQTVLRDAAREASHRGAPKDALRHLSPLLDQSPGDLRLRGQVAGIVAKVNPGEALAHLRAALELTSDPRSRAELAIEFGHSAIAVQAAQEAMDVLVSAADALYTALGVSVATDVPEGADRELCTRLEATVALVGINGRSTLTRVRERLAGVPEPVGDSAADRYLMAMHAINRVIAGTEPEQAVALARAALPLDLAGYSTPATSIAAVTFAVADESAQAVDALNVLVDNNETDGALWSLCQSLGMRAHMRYLAGEVSGAITDARTSIKIAGDEGWGPSAIGSAGLALALGLMARGELDQARETLASVVDVDLAESPFELYVWVLVDAMLRAAAGDSERAVKQLRHCGRRLEEDGVTNPLLLPWWAEATLLLAESGQARSARPLVEYGEDLVARWDVPRARALARIARAMVSRGTERIDLLTDAAVAMESSGAMLDRQRVEYLLGRELLRKEQPKAAREHLRTAAEIATWCGATTAAATVRELLVSAGGRMRQGTGARTDILTGSELRVVELAVGGATNREIADELFVTSRTVEVHLTNVYRKLGITGRADLATVLPKLTGMRRGSLDED